MRDYDELVKALREQVERHRIFGLDTADDMKLMDDAADAIEDLIAALTASNEVIAKSRDKWISVEERLPELYDDVLVYYERDAWPYGANVPIRKRETGVGFCGDPNRWHVGGCSKVKGIAWMPLPEPYEPPKEDADA